MRCPKAFGTGQGFEDVYDAFAARFLEHLLDEVFAAVQPGAPGRNDFNYAGVDLLPQQTAPCAHSEQSTVIFPAHPGRDLRHLHALEHGFFTFGSYPVSQSSANSKSITGIEDQGLATFQC